MNSIEYLELFAHIQYKGFSFSSVIAIIISLFLLFFSAFMSSSETAFFSLKPSELKLIRDRKDDSDRVIENLLKNSEHLLASILIGNNLVNIALVILLNYAIEDIFDFYQSLVIGFLLQTIFLTFILLLFGEIIPKVIAQRHPLKYSRFAAKKIEAVNRIFYPLSTLLVKSSAFISKIVARKNYDVSVDELQQAVHLTTEGQEEKQMINDVIKFYNKTASQIMIPRIDMVDLDYNWDLKKMLSYAVESGYSRLPVYDGSEDNIKGIIYLKDLLAHRGETDDYDWHMLLRPAYFVPDNKKIDDLLEEFRLNKIHIAIVVDEYGGTSGVITLEDILEEIVGEITDEYDEKEKVYKLMPDGSFLFEAKTALIDVCDVLGLDKDYFGEKADDVDTLGGLVLEIKEELVEVGDIISYKDFTFIVVSMDRRRITQVQVKQK